MTDRDHVTMASSAHRLARRALQAAKRKIVQQLGIVSDQKFYLDSGMVMQRTDVERIMLHCNEVDIEFTLPVDGTKVRNSYRPRFVYGLADATIDPVSNLIYDLNGQFIAESSSWLALRQLYSWPQPTLRKPRSRLPGESIFLPSNGYYHWLIEDLPVFLKSLAVSPAARVILPRNAAKYVREVAELVGNDVVFIDSAVRVERLIMTAKTAGMGSPLAGLTPHPADIAVLREFFAKYHTAGPPCRRLYLSRVGQKRSPANEAALQIELEEGGFVPFDGREMSLLSQIDLFSSARQLVGIHGAALSNLVWAPEGVDVCEIFSTDYLPSCYSALTAIRRGCYTAFSYNPGPENMIDSGTLERIAALAAISSCRLDSFPT